MSDRLSPNKVVASSDGSHTLFSNKYNAHYHSIHGALEESIHVFIAAGLYKKVREGLSSISIFEMGLGTGLNALLTLLEAIRFELDIHYDAIETDPVAPDTLTDLNYSELLSLDAAQENLFRTIHSSPWEEPFPIHPRFTMRKFRNPVEEHVFDRNYDIVYYDAFAPACQPRLWEEHLHTRIYNALNPGGILVSYCAQGAFKRTLKRIGYHLESLNGPNKKREMVRGRKIE